MREIDRALEVLLADELADRQPPDLTERIVVAACPRRVERQGTLAPRRRPGRASLWLGLAAGALCVLTPVAFVAWQRGGPAAPQPIDRVVTGTVLAGELRLEPSAGAPVRSHPAGAPFVLALTSGDRLRAHDDARTVVSLTSLGHLALAPRSVLEVKEVEWKQLGGGFVAGAITVSAAVGAATWFGSGETIVAPNQTLVLRDEGAGGDPTAASAQLEELAAARRRIAELENRLGERVPAAPTVMAADQDESQPEPATEFVATGSEFDEVLAGVDWGTVGKAVSSYLDVKKQIEELEAAGEPVPVDLRATADRWEGVLFEQIGAALESGIPGETMTARIHHPAVMTNLMHAAMAAAGEPLAASQLAAMQKLGERHAFEDAVRRASYDDQTLMLERAVDETELQHRSIAAQRALLSPAQEAVLSFGELGARVGVDPFGSGYQWSKFGRAVNVDSVAAFGERAVAGFSADLELSDAQSRQLAPLVQNWLSSWPQEWLGRPADDLDRRGSFHIERVRAAARLQVQLMRDMQHGLGLTPAQLEQLRSMRQIFVPFVR